MWFGPYLFHGIMLREINRLVMIKKVTNTNRLTQRKTLSFTLVAMMFVMMPLIFLRTPLFYFDSTVFELPLMLGSRGVHQPCWVRFHYFFKST